MSSKLSTLVAPKSSPLNKLRVKVRVYVAGKIAKNDWRHDLFPTLRAECFVDVTDQDRGSIVSGPFEYIGPLFQSCHHGCFHGDKSHGMLPPPKLCWEESLIVLENKKSVVRKCLNWIGKSEVVFAWIDSETAHATLMEIGYAIAKKKPVFVAFKSDVYGIDGGSLPEEMWFLETAASKSVVVGSVFEGWDQFAKWLAVDMPLDRIKAMLGTGWKTGGKVAYGG